MTILTVLFLLSGFILNKYRLKKVEKYLKENRNLKLKKKNSKFKINIIIPVLDEQNIIEEKLKYFSHLVSENKHLHIYIVSTVKDRGTPSTKSLIDSYIKRNNTSFRLKHLHYNKDGIMAHQLNYAISNIDNQNDIIGIYNIDSKINDKTIEFVIDFYSDSYNQKNVLQQVCIFDKKGNKPSIINSAIAWQNRWSLSFEMARYISLSEQHKNRFLFKDFQYVIGHGLFFPKAIIDGVGGFSQKDLNEDNQLGFKLMLKGINIKPIPYLEKGDFTSSITTYINQQSVWFNGPLYSFKYYKDLKPYSPNVSMMAKYYSFKNFFHALNWIGLPILFFLSLVKNIVQRRIINVVVILSSFYLYVTYINRICDDTVKNIFDYSGSVRSKDAFFKDIKFFLLHSVGPLKTLIKIVSNKNTQKNKYRTPKE